MDIIGYEGLYTIDEQGNVFGKKRNKVLKPTIHRQGYLRIKLCNDDEKQYYLHRLIATHFIPNPDNLPFVDHKNGITSDNRIVNLRWATRSQNQMNRKKQVNKTGYRCVYFHKSSNKYQASIRLNNELIHIGYFDTALEASQAYEAKALELFGEFRREIN